MGKNSNIEWTDHTFNPWIGCTKVSPGCANCYAEVNTSVRTKGIKWGKGQPRSRTSNSYWRQPITWNKVAHTNIEAHPHYAHIRPRVFCASLADWLDDEVPIEWLADLLCLIEDTPHLNWLLLTKRPDNWQARMWGVLNNGLPYSRKLVQNWVEFHMPPENVWLGTSVEDQFRADLRIPLLLSIPARIRFLSVEPMLGPIGLSLSGPPTDLGPAAAVARIHWAIFGGESGRNHRSCNIDWIRSGVKQCRAGGVRPFVKQLGSDPILEPGPISWPITDKKGGDMAEFPADLRIREFPE